MTNPFITEAYCLVSFDGCVVAKPFLTRELAEQAIASQGPMGFGLEIVEIAYDETPLDEEGLELKAKLADFFESSGTINFHQSVLPRYYEISLKERLRTTLAWLTYDPPAKERVSTIDGHLETTKFDEGFAEPNLPEPRDVRDWMKEFD